jgi:PAS domain S-box-containing protein
MKRLVTAIGRALRESAERKRRQAAESRIRELADFLNQAREAVIVTDLDGKITFWNQGAELLTGWTAAEALDASCERLFDSSTSAQLATAWRSARDGGEWAGEVELVDRRGQSRPVELHISLIRDDAGRPRARLALGTDVTERRASELRIREQAEMLNQAREAILIVNLENRIIYWNAGAERLFGWRSDEILGKRAEQVFDPAVTVAVNTARDETMARGQWLGELRVHNRARQPLVIESRQTLIRDEKGRPKARLCINSDITDRKRLEEQFLRSQRMENLGLLAAGIAHDLNNMLAPILLAAPMLREHVHDPGALGLLTTLEKSAERGANLVQQILSFAHGASSGEHRLVQVKHLLRDITSVIAGTFPKSIKLEDHIPSELWPVNGNATQIHQVMLNLCVNARDAMPQGGTLRLHAENRVIDVAAAQKIDNARPGPFLVLHVEDTGTGIPPDVLARMWEPFYTTKESGKGTGLGLSTVRGIVENHSGFVEVYTAVGRGSTFRIYLPAAEGVVTDRLAAPARKLPQGKGELILVVDDERHIRDMTMTMLSRHGYRVLIAADGAEAAVIFAQRAAEIRLVITDLHMPNLDGVMLGRALRRINPAAKLLVVSGMSSTLGARPDYKPDEFANGFLPKPFKPEALLAKVSELLSSAERVRSNPPFA